MAEEEQPVSAGADNEASARGRRQVKVGTVVSAKMDKTVVVKVEKPVMHRLYHRMIRRSSKFAAHDPENSCREGDLVALVATRPLSKSKRWRVREILKRAQG